MSNRPGMNLETAASIVLRDTIHEYFSQFAFVIRGHRDVATSVISEFRNGMAGSIALAIAGGHASKDDILAAEFAKLKEYVERDLSRLKKTV